jgi:hypothetical protein
MDEPRIEGEHRIRLETFRPPDLGPHGQRGACTCGWRGEVRSDGRAADDACRHHASATAATRDVPRA